MWLDLIENWKVQRLSVSSEIDRAEPKPHRERDVEVDRHGRHRCRQVLVRHGPCEDEGGDRVEKRELKGGFPPEEECGGGQEHNKRDLGTTRVDDPRGQLARQEGVQERRVIGSLVTQHLRDHRGRWIKHECGSEHDAEYRKWREEAEEAHLPLTGLHEEPEREKQEDRLEGQGQPEQQCCRPFTPIDAVPYGSAEKGHGCERENHGDSLHLLMLAADRDRDRGEDEQACSECVAAMDEEQDDPDVRSDEEQRDEKPERGGRVRYGLESHEREQPRRWVVVSELGIGIPTRQNSGGDIRPLAEIPVPRERLRPQTRGNTECDADAKQPRA